MERERVIEGIRKANKVVDALPSKSMPARAVYKVLVELLSFCEEATIRIDDASRTNSPIRADMLLSLVGDIQKDASIVDMLLKLDPEYDEVRLHIAEGVELFSKYASRKIKTSVILMPLDSSTVH